MLSVNPEKKTKGQPNPVDVHVGRRIRMRRVWMDTSQQALAVAIGVNFQQVQNVAHRWRDINPEASTPWGKAAGLAGVSDGAKTVQGCRRCAGKQNRTNSLGTPRQGRYL